MTKLNIYPKVKWDLQFASEIKKGLSQNPKQLSSKYFYDQKGDKLFQQIMAMPTYYLTNAETEILSTYKSDLLEYLVDAPFEVVELGAGDGTKTSILLKYFAQHTSDFSYRPIDISANALEILTKHMQSEIPDLSMAPLQGEYFEVLERLTAEDVKKRKLVLFMGANIGNLEPDKALGFLNKLYNSLEAGDFLLIGFDLKKDPQQILDAYNDKEGITAAFNLNLLERINRELGANFQLDSYKHWETYDPVSGATKSYIVSLKNQIVYIPALQRSFQFKAWEPIDVELSQKYNIEEIEKVAQQAGFKVENHFYDQHEWFVDSLWVK